MKKEIFIGRLYIYCMRNRRSEKGVETIMKMCYRYMEVGVEHLTLKTEKRPHTFYKNLVAIHLLQKLFFADGFNSLTSNGRHS